MGGRIDICLVSNETPVFYVESKLQAELTISQLRRYRKQGVQYLIAITRNRPEVSRAQLKREGIFTLRWQDIHSRLASERPPTHVDRFISGSLTAYMEELGMAHRERVTMKDLECCRRLFSAVSSPENINGLSLRSGFMEIDWCLKLLGDLKAELIEIDPTFLKRLPQAWGPGYYSYENEDGVKYNALGWTQFKGPWNSKRPKFGCGFLFPSDKSDIRFYSSYGDHWKEREVAKLLSGSARSVEAVTRVVSSDWRRWR